MGRGKRMIGSIGENIAVEFLKRKGYKIVATNIRTPFGELDIIARQKDLTVFVEVKTRTTSSLGPPYLSVTKAKELHLVRNALAYLKRRNLVDSYWRIDVVSVKLDHECKLEHIELIENAVERRYGGYI
jgi:putative endonuclease